MLSPGLLSDCGAIRRGRRLLPVAMLLCCAVPLIVAQTGRPAGVATTGPGTSDPVSVTTDQPPVMPGPTPESRPAAEADTGGVPTTAASPSAAGGGVVKPKDYYGLWSLAPAGVAIVLAIVTRQVIVALVLGILTAAGMMVFMRGGFSPTQLPLDIITFAVDNYLLDVLAPLEEKKGVVLKQVEFDHIKILVFTLLIGGMVGVIQANGGTQALVLRLTRRVKRREQGQVRAFLAGLAVFFDDYANAMIVGPSMRPIFDRLRLSREKLAYIVDSTAAPVASIFIGTWLAAEIGYIQDGLDKLGDSAPSFLAEMNGVTAFWGSIPYRTYALLALVMVFLVAITGRDFGSMRKAESRAVAERRSPPSSEEVVFQDLAGRAWLGLTPILVLVFMTFGLLAMTGWRVVASDTDLLEQIRWDSFVAGRDSLVTILGKSDANASLLYASLTALVIAVLTSIRTLTLSKTMDAVTSGVSRMFAACIVLVLAWGLSDGGSDLQLGYAVSGYLGETVFSPEAGVERLMWLPPAIFIAACIVSFATGTSWGTMAILCPATVVISASVMSGLPEDQARALFYASVGAVLTGAVFGDHCSPISDTTVLSSIASECDLGRHVWTQMPYALTVAVVGILSTDGLNFALRKYATDFYDHTWTAHGYSQYYGLGVGVLLLVLIIFIIGRRPKGIVTEPPVRQAA